MAYLRRIHGHGASVGGVSEVLFLALQGLDGTRHPERSPGTELAKGFCDVLSSQVSICGPRPRFDMQPHVTPPKSSSKKGPMGPPSAAARPFGGVVCMVRSSAPTWVYRDLASTVVRGWGAVS